MVATCFKYTGKFYGLDHKVLDILLGFQNCPVVTKYSVSFCTKLPDWRFHYY